MPCSAQDPLNPGYGQIMAPFLNAQIHQHFFQVRLDMAVDDDNGGKGLVVTEVSPPLSSPTHADSPRLLEIPCMGGKLVQVFQMPNPDWVERKSDCAISISISCCARLRCADEHGAISKSISCCA